MENYKIPSIEKLELRPTECGYKFLLYDVLFHILLINSTNRNKLKKAQRILNKMIITKLSIQELRNLIPIAKKHLNTYKETYTKKYKGDNFEGEFEDEL
jgi:hypothetical protein